MFKRRPSRNMRGTAVFLAAALLLTGIIMTSSCAASAFRPIPLVPPAYLDCVQATPFDLEQAYFGNFGSRSLAAQIYNGKPVVLKNIEMTETMLKTRDKNYVWVDSIKIISMVGNALARLKAGDVVDIVGINNGVMPSNFWALYFTGSLFLPAGSVALPASGDSTMPYKAGY